MIHQSLTKDLRCTLWLYQLLFSHLLEGLLHIPCKTCWCDHKSIFFKKAHPSTQFLFRAFRFSLCCFIEDFCCAIRRCRRMQIIAPLSRGVLVLPYCCRTKNLIKIRGKKKKKYSYWRKRGGSLMKADWEHLEAVFRGRTLSEQPWHLSTARS